VPMDWIIFFYFGLGVVSVLGFLPQPLRKTLGMEPVENTNLAASAPSKYTWQAVLIIATIVTTASLIPVADNMLPVDQSLCNNNSLQDVVSQVTSASL